MSENKRLTARQRRAVAALLVAKDTREAAQLARVGESTLYRWLSDPGFRAELEARQGEAIEAAMARLAGLSSLALSVLEQTMTDDYATDSARVRAAEAVLRHLERLGDRIAGRTDLTLRPLVVRWSDPPEPRQEENS